MIVLVLTWVTSPPKFLVLKREGCSKITFNSGLVYEKNTNSQHSIRKPYHAIMNRHLVLSVKITGTYTVEEDK